MDDMMDKHGSDEIENDAAGKQEDLEKLCSELKDYFPEEALSMLKSIEPIELAIYSLWKMGGRIREDFPNIDLIEPYDLPEGADQLDDTIRDYSFKVAKTPLRALCSAPLVEEDVDEMVIQAHDLKKRVPIIMKKEDMAQHVYLLNFESRELEMPGDMKFSLNIDMTGSESEQEAAMDKCMKELENYLDKVKDCKPDPAEMFKSAEEEQAVKAWAEKHDFKIAYVLRASIDRYF